MSFAQFRHRKSLRRLSGPELRAIGSVCDHSLGINALDGVTHRCGGNDRATLQECFSAAIEHLRRHQATGAVVNEHMACIPRQRLQTSLHRLLPGASPLNPGHGLPCMVKQGRHGGMVQRLTNHTDPIDRLRGTGSFQGPREDGSPMHSKQKLVAIRPHAPATAGCSNQQMHKRLLLTAG